MTEHTDPIPYRCDECDDPACPGVAALEAAQEEAFENAVCAVCHGPTDTETCSESCAADLALTNGHITDYPEETNMPDTAPVEERCSCRTADADCLDCRTCLAHHDLDDCDNWAEWSKDGWH